MKVLLSVMITVGAVYGQADKFDKTNCHAGPHGEAICTMPSSVSGGDDPTNLKATKMCKPEGTLECSSSAMVPDPPKPAPLTELQQLKIQNLGYQQMIAKLGGDVADRDKQISELRAQLLQYAQSGLVSEVCEAAGLEVKGCNINPSDKTVSGSKKAAYNKDKESTKEGQ